jgi:hypothetical protein
MATINLEFYRLNYQLTNEIKHFESNLRARRRRSDSQRIVAQGGPDARYDFILGKLLERDRFPPDLGLCGSRLPKAVRQVLGRSLGHCIAVSLGPQSCCRGDPGTRDF